MKTGIFADNFKISVNAIKSNLLRTILTILIIAIGIMALTGIMTAVESIKSTLASEFTSLGANTFSITRIYSNRIGHGRQIESKRISYEDAIRFKREFNFPAKVSINVTGTRNAIVKYNQEKTNPTVGVVGIDEKYLIVSSLELEDGRNFSENEVLNGDNIAILGEQLKEKLFKNGENPTEKSILIGNIKYQVVGILKGKGASFGGEGDNFALIPLNNARQKFNTQYNNYKISIMPEQPALLEFAISESEGLFRKIRNLSVYDENNFDIRKSDSFLKMLLDNTKIITQAATIIGLLTLLGAAVGLMNIMLVSVSERTQEIGIRKAIGAKSKTIKQQFLMESILIGQFGGILGIILGISAGNAIAIFTNTDFVVPIFWIIIGIILCFIVSIISGYFPAVKASKLDPIVALHYE